MDGSATRVPFPDAAIVEFYTTLKKKVMIEEVNKAMNEAANSSFEYSENRLYLRTLLVLLQEEYLTPR
nr:hypothetical protein [Alkalibacterium subtropicum]